MNKNNKHAMKTLLTASRINAFLDCQRKHFWSYEIGLRRETSSLALHIGSAWHRAMESRSKGADYDGAIAAALPDGIDLDALTTEIVAALLAGYYANYGDSDSLIKDIYPEVEFHSPLSGSRSFVSAGKIDGLAVLHDGRIAMIEHKTCSEDISPTADYWIRLRWNNQVLQYVTAARSLGWNIETVVYDVTRKPSISPRQIPLLDPDGCKIVNDSTGQRVFNKNGKPRESASTENGWTMQTRTETPEEFGERLLADTRERPDFYFARREVPVLDDDLAEFREQRLVISRQILQCRGQERRLPKREHAWPRNLAASACRFCDYTIFCHQNTSPDLEHPPAGFRVGVFNPELSNMNQEENTNENSK